MITALRTFGRLSILLSLSAIILAATVVVEILIDSLTMQARDLHHLLMHSLGNIGTLMILLSLAGYMVKKQYKRFPGKLKDWLDVHQLFAIIGVVLIGVHGGAHFRAIVPVATALAMLAATLSGLVGRYIYVKARKEINARKSELVEQGLSREQAEEQLILATVTAQALSKWRVIHRPISYILAVLISFHIVSALYFGG